MQLYNMMNILTILLLNHLLQTKSQNDDIFEDNGMSNNFDTKPYTHEDGLEDRENLMDQSTTVPPSVSTFPTTRESQIFVSLIVMMIVQTLHPTYIIVI
ncbi:hypothetical protein KSF78_0008998 [Schistosoma japonicum]|nr:hypothetical protein KSF78_0008998 [Schistosoma japonicum]